MNTAAESVLNPAVITEDPGQPSGPAALEERRQRTARHLAGLAERRGYWIDNNRYYYNLLARLLRFLVEPGKRVPVVRCNTGDLLAAVNPSYGVGVEICSEMIAVAKRRNPAFTYVEVFPDTSYFPAHLIAAGEKFDYIIFNDIDDTVDVQRIYKIFETFATATRASLFPPTITFGNLWSTWPSSSA